MLPFLVHNIFTIYTNGVLNCKCPAPGPKGQSTDPAAQKTHCIIAQGVFKTTIYPTVDIDYFPKKCRTAGLCSEDGLCSARRTKRNGV